MTPPPDAFVRLSSDALSADIDPKGAHCQRSEIGMHGFALEWRSGRVGRSRTDPVSDRRGAGRRNYRLDQRPTRCRDMDLHATGCSRREREPISRSFRLSDDEETLRVYPFHFNLDIRFQLSGARCP